MDQHIRLMIEQLTGKGIEITDIPAFIRDMVNSIVISPYISLSELNRRMLLMGWNDIELDGYTLQFIVKLFESDLDSTWVR